MPVAPNHRAQVGLAPVVEEEAVIIRALGHAPRVERFLHHDEAEAVAQVEELGRGGIVRSADGVAAQVAHEFELSLHRAQVQRGTQRAEIVVQTNALDVEALAVEEKTIRGRELNRADAEQGLDDVGGFAVLLERGDGNVTMRRGGAPEFRLPDNGGELG